MFKVIGDFTVPQKILQRAEITANLVMSRSLRQTANQVNREALREIQKTKYSTMKQADIKPFVETFFETGKHIMSGNQQAGVRIKGRQIPLTFFGLKEKVVKLHPLWGQLWETTITVFGKRQKMKAFHLEGKGTLQRGGPGKHPMAVTKNSKLFTRVDDGPYGASLPIKRFKMFSVAGLVRSLGIDEKLQNWGDKKLVLNLNTQWNRQWSMEERAKARGISVDALLKKVVRNLES